MSSAIGTAGTAELWSAALEQLERKYSKPIFEMWLKPMRLVELGPAEIVLSVHSNFARDWVENRLKNDISHVLHGLLGEAIALRFVVADGGDGADGRPAGSFGNPSAAARRVAVGQSQPALFVRRVRGRATATALRMPPHKPSPKRRPKPTTRSFCTAGSVWARPTSCTRSATACWRANPNANVVYVSSEKFTNEFIIAIKNNQTVEFRNRYRHVDVLLIDDIQFLEGKEQTQEEFFHTFNSLHEAQKQLVISSDRPPKEIQTLESRLRSRFEWGLLTDIQPPDLETREAILRKKAEAEKIPVPDEVTSFIAKVIPSNIRELEGSLIRVVAFASLTRSPISVDLAAEALKNAVAQAPIHRITIPLIKERVAKAHGLSVKEMDNPRRDQRVGGAAPHRDVHRRGTH